MDLTAAAREALSIDSKVRGGGLEVVSNSPAAGVGLRPGDVIIDVNGVKAPGSPSSRALGKGDREKGQRHHLPAGHGHDHDTHRVTIGRGRRLCRNRGMRAVIESDQGMVSVDGEPCLPSVGLGCLIGVKRRRRRDIDSLHKICGLRIFDAEKRGHEQGRGRGGRRDPADLSSPCWAMPERAGRPSYSRPAPRRRAGALQKTVAEIASLHSGKVATGRYQTTWT